MDIRRFFTTTSANHNTRKQPANGNEDKAEKKKKSSKSSKGDKDSKSKSSKRRRVAYISDSSDSSDVEFVEETATPKKKLKTDVDGPGVRSSPRHKKNKTPTKQEEKKKEQRSAADFFGTKKVTSGSKAAPKSIASKLASESKKPAAGKSKANTKSSAAVNPKDEIIVLDTDQDAWSDDESFAQLVDDKKTEQHDDQTFNKLLEQTKSKSPAKASSSESHKESKSKKEALPSPKTAIKVKKHKSPAKAKASDKYKPLPVSDGSPEEKKAETPRSKSRRLQEATPDQTPKSRVDTPTKKSGSQTSTRSGNRSITPTEKPASPDKSSEKSETNKKVEKESKVNKKTEKTKTEASTSKSIDKVKTSPSKKSQLESPQKRAKAVSLKGKTFVLTGQLSYMDRGDAKLLIEKQGGRVVSAISGKVNYVVAGEEAGVSKMAKAEKIAGCKIVTETEFYSLLGLSEDGTEPGTADDDGFDDDEQSFMEVDDLPIKAKSTTTATSSVMPKRAADSGDSKVTPSSPSKPAVIRDPTQDLLWVEKYKPMQLGKIIGQSGDRSNAKKLLAWLKNWHRHKKLGTKPVSSFGGWGGRGGGGGGGDGAGFRAALLSGPPGIGKTTTATLVCKEAGFTFFETNASDSRSKKILQETIGGALGNATLMDYVANGTVNHETENKKHCIIMDEVDGMAGNEDRGGMQELISLIKNSSIPVICICNDRQSQKVRSLANSCFDLRFQRPRIEQIKGAMMTVCMRERIDIDSASLNDVIEASNHDIRQILHNLSVWSATNDKLDSGQVKKDSRNAHKDFKKDAFTACRMAFNESETANMSLIDKSDLFFYDYSMHPLFIQENYINASPHASSTESDKLKRLAKAANSIAMGDVVNKAIRMDRWGLLPMQAMFSSVLPCEAVMGHLSSQIQFPRWLGKFSSTNKYFRMNNELTMHMGLSITGSAQHVLLDYLPMFKDCLTTPLIRDEQTEGINKVVGMMNDYDLVKDDYDAILELTQWPGQKDPRTQIESKTKAAMTRYYNKLKHKHHYALDAGPVKKKRGAAATVSADIDIEGEADSDVDSDEEVVKALKVQSKKTASKTTAKPKAKAEKKPRAPAKKKK